MLLSNKLLICIILLIFFNYSIIAYPLYDNTKSNVVNLNPKNFDTQITHTRAKTTVSLVHFYTNDDLKSNGYKVEIEKVASDYDGMFKIAAIDCKQFRELCEKQDVREYPQIKIYPPLPAPVFPFEGEINSKNIITSLGRFVDNKTQEVHTANIDSFTNDMPNLPKVILFTDKPGVPLIYKVLAVQFDKKMNFGVVRKEESSIVQKYKVNKFPRIMVIQVNTKKTEFFEKENKFKYIFDFLNPYSETFHRVGEDKVNASDSVKEDKPWLNEKLPELNEKSGNDLCFKVEGVICVVIVTKGKPDGKISEIVNELQNYLTPKIDYGSVLKYKFSWVNTDTQAGFLSIVGVKDAPKALIINPGKRKRYFVMEEDVDLNNLKNVFDKLVSGDLRFSMFPGNNFPELNN